MFAHGSHCSLGVFDLCLVGVLPTTHPPASADSAPAEPQVELSGPEADLGAAARLDASSASEDPEGLDVSGASLDRLEQLRVRTQLQAVLRGLRGRILVDDVITLAHGSRHSSASLRLVAGAMRDLGWVRRRCRFEGVLRYAYVKGSRLQREAVLDLGQDATGAQIVVSRNSQEGP